MTENPRPRPRRRFIMFARWRCRAPAQAANVRSLHGGLDDRAEVGEVTALRRDVRGATRLAIEAQGERDSARSRVARLELAIAQALRHIGAGNGDLAREALQRIVR